MSPFGQSHQQLLLIAAPLVTMAVALLAVPVLYSLGVISSRPLRMGHLPSFNLPPEGADNAMRSMERLVKLDDVSDPFETIKTAAHTAEKQGEVALNMVILAENEGLCKVNGKFYRKGESGPGFSILKIEETGVWFSTIQGTFFLSPGQKRLIVSYGENDKAKSRRLM